MRLHRSMLAATLAMVTMAAGCGNTRVGPVGPMLIAAGAVGVGLTVESADDTSCKNWAPLEEQCHDAVDAVNGAVILLALAVAAVGVELIAIDLEPSHPESDEMSPPPATPSTRPPRILPPAPPMRPAARRLDRQLRMEVAGDLCHDAARTFERLGAIDPEAAQRALADDAIRTCVEVRR